MDKLKMQSENLVDDNIEFISARFPNCITESMENGKVAKKVDFDMLRQELSDVLIEGGVERYRLDWAGKRQAILTANSPVAKTLRPAHEESVNFDITENLYIEGDNLDVLKLLHHTYLGKIKMIYIDPPYNTGNDFVYNDDFAEGAEEYLVKSNQKDDQGNRMETNKETSGRFHSDWLSMMYMRLKIAKDLMTDDGIIFISIDDKEQSNLKRICNEIFGEDNFRNTIIVRRGAKSIQAQFKTWDKLGQDTEYVLFYTKNSNYKFPQQRKKLEQAKQGSWNNHWRGTDRPTMRYELFGITPESGQWRWGKENSLKAIDNYNKMLSVLGVTSETVTEEQIDEYCANLEEEIYLLRLSKSGKPEHYISSTDSILLNSSWYDLLIGSSSEITNLFETKVFDTAKLTTVIKRMLGFCEKNAIVLDFFSGSATTAHAIMQMNAEDGGERKFIMVQLPELTKEDSEAYRAGYKNICEIGKERIRRAGKKIKDENPITTMDLDTGFRVLKLDDSNMRDVFYSPKQYNQTMLAGLGASIKEDRTEEDVLFQIMLERGVSLSSKIEQRKTSNGRQSYYIVGSSDFEIIDLICVLDSKIDAESVKEVAKLQPECCVFLDHGIKDDATRVNIQQIFDTYSQKTKIEVL